MNDYFLLYLLLAYAVFSFALTWLFCAVAHLFMGNDPESLADKSDDDEI